MPNTAPTSGPLKQALLKKLLANNQIAVAAVGGIMEGINVADTITYPYVVYSLAFAPIIRMWGSSMLLAGFDIVVRGPNPVEVNSLDALITAELDDSTLTVTGLDTLIVRREEELPLAPERDAEGKRIYQNGANYLVWVDKNHDTPP